ncbi:MAG TPA: NB-ARC domain-containing protein, partial [Thermomicrobiales bacterium]|nr:NB-ARC domain-containing protein [Thermomicrobiales bacterium]
MGPPFIPDSGLPAALTPLVGRASDVAAVAASLRQPEVRLATLTGPGGVGKTRLALEAVAALSGDFPDGVRFISLAAIVDPDLLALTIVQQLGLAPAAATPPEARLAWFLRDRALLLVLDNFEQIVDAAPILTELLAACPKMKMLVTSRVRLRLSGEHEHVVPPLALVERGGVSSLERARASAAVQLFVARAQATNDAFVLSADNAAAIAAICDRLDGLPLAIELAAARVKTLPPAALLARLERRLPLLTGGARDLPARQQTMRDAIAWSHALLAPAAPSLFRRLAVFVGGFTVEAAAALLDPAADAAIGALDEVNALVDASLVRPEATTTGEPRFLMLETIREYAAERLVASGEEAMMRRAHAAYFLRWAEDVRGDRSRNLAPAALPL